MSDCFNNCALYIAGFLFVALTMAPHDDVVAGNGFVMIISKLGTRIFGHVNNYFVHPGKLHLYYTMQ